MPEDRKRRVRTPETRTLRKAWDDDFENISSNTQGVPRRPDYMEERIRRDEARRRAEQNRPRRRPQPKPVEHSRTAPPPRPNGAARSYPQNIQELPRWDAPPKRTSPPPRTAPNPERAAPQSRRRAKKKLSSAGRRLLLVLAVGTMAIVTALLLIFLLFPITEIKVTGEAISGVTNEEIIAISGCEVGDNLFFLSRSSCTEKIEEQIPYVRSAKLVKHFPGTAELQLTAAQAAACVYADGSWLSVNEDGKILESTSAPQSGVMQIIGLSPEGSELGHNVSVPDEETRKAYQEILTALSEVRAGINDAYGGLNPDGFTVLDMTDLTDIKMYYENRVELKFGGTLDLDYKVKAGCRFLLEMTTRETGVMDLTASGDTKRAYFTPGELNVPSTPTADSADVGADTDEPAADPTPAPSQSPREEGIPTAPYTGSGG